jgi:hypothetical protein
VLLTGLHQEIQGELAFRAVFRPGSKAPRRAKGFPVGRVLMQG